MSVLKFSPASGELYTKNGLSGSDYRCAYPRQTWRFNPWTGEARVNTQIDRDPFGFSIQPPNEPLYAALKSAQEILDAQPVPTEDRMLHDGETLHVGESAQDTITTTLSERGKRYGKFTGHAKITQDLKAVMHGCPKWAALAPDQKEALEMTAHKIGRILNGDPDYDDSWVDIAGYTKLVADRLQGVER